jgi:hypothetical protein
MLPMQISTTDCTDSSNVQSLPQRVIYTSFTAEALSALR